MKGKRNVGRKGLKRRSSEVERVQGDNKETENKNKKKIKTVRKKI